LYVTPRGLTTGPVPDPGGLVTLTFDFCDPCFVVEAQGGAREAFPLQPMSVAEFFARAGDAIEAVGGQALIHGSPSEWIDAIPFAADNVQRPYDAEAVRRFHQALVSVSRVFE